MTDSMKRRVLIRRMLFTFLGAAAAGCASAPPPPPRPDEPPAVETPAAAPEIRYVDASTLNVRRGPGPDEPSVGTLAQWQAVRVLERSANGWARIEAREGGVAGWVSAGYLAAESPWEPRPPAAGDVPLSARVEFNEFQFTFHNMNDFDWRDATIYVNPGSPGATYTYQVDVIPAEGSRNLGAWRFRNAADEKLDPSRIDFGEIEITCDTPTGRGYWSARGRR